MQLAAGQFAEEDDTVYLHHFEEEVADGAKCTSE
jgi:hypothetical protein